MDYKVILGLLSIPINIALCVPYIYDIFYGKTRPHMYSWFVWCVAYIVATIVGYMGGGGIFILVTLGVPALFNTIIFIVSIKYGTKDITQLDKYLVSIALGAIGVYIFLNNPILAVILVSLADGIGYIPTYRKTFHQPYSELWWFWLGAVVANLLVIVSLVEYNLHTLTYVCTILFANISLLLLILIRRRYINNNKKQGNKSQNHNL